MDEARRSLEKSERHLWALLKAEGLVLAKKREELGQALHGLSVLRAYARELVHRVLADCPVPLDRLSPESRREAIAFIETAARGVNDLLNETGHGVPDGELR